MDLRELGGSPKLASSDDDSDDEFIPGPECEVSEESNSGVSEDEHSDNDIVSAKKNTKRRSKVQGGKQSRKRTRKTEEDKQDSPAKEEPVDESVAKQKADNLWSDFLKDTEGIHDKRKQSDDSASNLSNGSVKPPTTDSSLPKEQKKVSVTEVFEFAGEKVEVTKEVPLSKLSAAPSSVKPKPKGLSGVLSLIGKKQKLGTLEKSKLDWDKFKKSQGIQDELETYKKGKDGYLEKLDFLQRTDNRLFEIEKGMRSSKRSQK